MTTNVLDGLVARVLDPDLRAALHTEISVLRETKQFGLVFERHFPENVRLVSHPIRRGVRVQLRDTVGNGETWFVAKVEGETARLQGADGSTSDRALRELVVVREFGEPVYPGLKRLGAISNGGDRRPHLILKGENHHALHTLLYVYEGQVDCIYIDPPYNSGGARDWKYNNDYVAEDDAYRHSKWLSFMEKRLRLAKRLLNPADSVLIVAIDENEVHRLNLLLSEIFRGSKIQMVSALTNPAGASIIDQFSRVDEQLFFVHIGAARPKRTIAETTPLETIISDPLNDQETAKPRKKKAFSPESLQRSGGNSRRKDTKAKFFPIYIDPKIPRIIGCGDHLPLGTPLTKAPTAPGGLIQQWPIKEDKSEACWQLSAPTFRRYMDEGRIRLGRKKKNGAYGISFLTKGHMKAIENGELVVTGRDANGAMIVKDAEGRSRTRVGKTMWINGAYSATEHGSTLLRSFIPGRKFSFPKSLYAVEDALRFYVADKPDALILDFFAGSGTTAHAVARLNRQDGGRRVSVCVTNNEVSGEEADELRAEGFLPGDADWESRGIFDFITRPRIEAAFNGRRTDGEPVEYEYRFIDPFPAQEGFKENVEFLELTYLERTQVERKKSFSSIAPLLWLKAGAEGALIEQENATFCAPEDARYAILFNLALWQNFADEIRNRSDLKFVYVVTDSVSQFQQIRTELPDGVEASMLYEDYLRNFEIRAGVTQ